MTINRNRLVRVKEQKKLFVTLAGIHPEDIKELFYNNIENNDIGNQGEKKRTLEYCKPKWKSAEGTFQGGVKYTFGEDVYYMVWSTNGYWHNPIDIYVGKAKDGIVYTIYENFLEEKADTLGFFEIPQGFIDDIPINKKLYKNTVYVKSSDFRHKCITNEDVKCFNEANEALFVFRDLINELTENI